MASSRQLRTAQIASLLKNNRAPEICDNESEGEDCVTQDQLRSDVEDEVVDYVDCSNDSAGQETLDNDGTCTESTNTYILAHLKSFIEIMSPLEISSEITNF